MKKRIEVDFVDFAITALLLESVFVESIHHGDDNNLETRAANRTHLRVQREPTGFGNGASERAKGFERSRLRSSTSRPTRGCGRSFQ